MKKKYIMPEFVVYLVNAEDICQIGKGSGNANDTSGPGGESGDGFSKGNGMWEYMDNDD